MLILGDSRVVIIRQQLIDMRESSESFEFELWHEPAVVAYDFHFISSRSITISMSVIQVLVLVLV